MSAEHESSMSPVIFQRNALATLLVANGYGHLQQLALLGRDEKSSVAALMLIAYSVGVHSREVDCDATISAQFRPLMEHLSPAIARALVEASMGDSENNGAESLAQDLRHFRQWLEAVTPQLTSRNQQEPGAPSR